MVEHRGIFWCPLEALQYVCGTDNRHLQQINGTGVRTQIDPGQLIRRNHNVVIQLSSANSDALNTALQKLSGCLMRYIPLREARYRRPRENNYRHRNRPAEPYRRGADLRRNPSPQEGHDHDNGAESDVVDLHGSPLNSDNDDQNPADGQIVPH